MQDLRYSSLTLLDITPPGVVFPYLGINIPAGFLMCDGTEVSRIQYASLFDAIGDLYGVGDGSTTFNLPDLRDNFLRCSSSTRSVGTKENDDIKSHSHTHSMDLDGSHDHSTSVSEEGKHSHTYADYYYNYDTDGNEFIQYKQSDSASVMAGEDETSRAGKTSTAGKHSHTVTVKDNGLHKHALTINSTGGTETRPMNVTVHFIIKI